MAIAAVLGAAGYLLGLVWKGVAGERAGSCATGCGKCSSSAPEPVEVVTIGAAKPSRPA